MVLASHPLHSFPLKISKPISKTNYQNKTHSFLACNCEKNPSFSDNEEVSAMVDELLKKEENKQLLDGLNEASERVDRARMALADFERQEDEARKVKEYVSQLESRKLEIEESQRELLEARVLVEEAERSLSSNIVQSPYQDTSSEEINKDLERRESAKAAFISAIIGTLASVPICLYQDTSYTQLALDLSYIFVSCALFGVTFRYTIRRDLDNVQLKTGTSAAFGVVKGLAALGAGNSLEFDLSSLVSYSIDGAVYVAESVFIFLFASVALDYCFKMRLLSPFPVRNIK